MEEIIHEYADKVGSAASQGQDLLSLPVFGHSTGAHNGPCHALQKFQRVSILFEWRLPGLIPLFLTGFGILIGHNYVRCPKVQRTLQWRHHGALADILIVGIHGIAKHPQPVPHGSGLHCTDLAEGGGGKPVAGREPCRGLKELSTAHDLNSIFTTRLRCTTPVTSKNMWFVRWRREESTYLMQARHRQVERVFHRMVSFRLPGSAPRDRSRTAACPTRIPPSPCRSRPE
jgi:hypothetical protein